MGTDPLLRFEVSENAQGAYRALVYVRGPFGYVPFAAVSSVPGSGLAGDGDPDTAEDAEYEPLSESLDDGQQGDAQAEDDGDAGKGGGFQAKAGPSRPAPPRTRRELKAQRKALRRAFKRAHNAVSMGAADVDPSAADALEAVDEAQKLLAKAKDGHPDAKRIFQRLLTAAGPIAAKAARTALRMYGIPIPPPGQPLFGPK